MSTVLLIEGLDLTTQAVNPAVVKVDLQTLRNLLDTTTATADAALPASSYTAADVLAKLLTVDTNSAGINATTLQGQAPSAFLGATATAADSAKVGGLLPAVLGRQGLKSAAQLNVANSLLAGLYTNNGDGILNGDGSTFAAGWFHVIHLHHTHNNGYDSQIALGYSGGAEGSAYLRYSAGTTWGAWQKLWHAGNDGAGSGLDADTFRGSAMLDATYVWAPGAIGHTGSMGSPTFAVSGAVVGDHVLVSCTTVQPAGVDAYGEVTAPGVVRVVVRNLSGVSQTLGSATWNVRVWKR